METHHAPILPTPFVPPQSEEDEVVDTKLAVFSAQEDDPDLPSEVGMRRGVAKVWACSVFLGKIMTALHLEWKEVGDEELGEQTGIPGPR